MREIKNIYGRVIYTADADVETWKELVEKAALSDASLRRADLSGADLRRADLSGANLSGANLSGADLRRADLRRADLRRADLSGANLSGADLSGANLSGANLSGADLSGETVLPAFWVLPEEGSFIAWKATANHIAKLEIPAEAKRTANLKNRKCRAEFVKVLAIYQADGKTLMPEGYEAYGRHDSDVIYKVGETVTADEFDDDIRQDCTHGIHFWITKQEAIDYLN